jgi:hypothetical protein
MVETVGGFIRTLKQATSDERRATRARGSDER